MPYIRPIDAFTEAIVSMAGPAAEAIMYHHARGTDDDVVRHILDSYREALESAESEGEWAEPDDYTDAGLYAMAVLPLVLAIVAENWGIIENIAVAALASPRALSYRQIEDIYRTEQQRGPSREGCWLERWNLAASGQADG